MPRPFKRKNGIFYVISSRNGRRIWKSLHTRDESEASDLCKEYWRSYGSGGKLTLQQLWVHLRPICDTDLSPKTVKLYDLALKELTKTVGKKNVTLISGYDIELFKIARSRQVKNLTLNKDLRTLKAFFERAKRLEFVEKNPVIGCKLPRAENQDARFLLPAECDQLLETITDECFRNVVLFALSTAMRSGEIASLEWSDIDFERREITISNKPGFRTKSGRRRIVPMNMSVYYVLADKARNTSRVLVRADGKPYSVKLISDLFRKWRRKAGLQESIHFHSLRHTAITWMHDKGIPSECIRQIAGHSTITTTHLYTHTTPGHLHTAISSLDSILQKKTVSLIALHTFQNN